MDNLRIGRAFKEDVLEEWRERDEEQRAWWRGLVARNRFDVRKKVVEGVDKLRHFISGEFGEPTEREKRDMLFSAVQGEYYACRKYHLKFGDVEGAMDCQHELDGKTALSIAAENGDLRLGNFFLSRGANPHIRDRFGCIALHYAASAGALDLMQLLLEAGSEVDTRDRLGVTPLMRAAEVGDADAVDLLIEWAAAPGARDRIEKWTPLHYAAKSGDVDTIVVLLKAGADFSSLSSTKQTAQDIALDLNEQEAAVVLGKWRRRILFPSNKFSLEALEDLDLFD